MKNAMKCAVLVAGFMVALGGGGVFADEARQITMQGQGVVITEPDLATVRLGMTQKGKSPAEAMAMNARVMATVLELLRAQGVASRDMQTDSLTLNADWVHDPKTGQNNVDGYVASNILAITIRDLDRVGPLLDLAINAGANNLMSLNFGLTDSRPQQDQARVSAAKDARAKAELYAAALGLTLGPISHVSENGHASPPTMMRAEAMFDAGAATPVEGGSLSVEVSVTVTWQLVDAAATH